MKKRDEEKIRQDKGILDIPTYIFTDRSISVLEAIVEYLKDERSLSLAKISRLLKRDDRTIWTVYNRVRKKRNEAK